MNTYKVTWTIELTADSPIEAARTALEIQRDPDSMATIFDVRRLGYKRTKRIDCLSPTRPREKETP